METLIQDSLLLEATTIKLSLKDGYSISEQSDNHLNIVNETGFMFGIANITPAVGKAICMLTTQYLSRIELGNMVFDSGGLGEMSLFLFNLDKLEKSGCIQNIVLIEDKPCFCFDNMIGTVNFDLESILNRRFKLSKFSYIRRENKHFIIESSKGTSKITIYDGFTFNILDKLVEFKEADDFMNANDDSNQTILAFLVALNAGEYLDYEPTTDDISREDFWSFHDLLFHTRTRFGRTNYKIGATYRFIGKKAHKKAIRELPDSIKEIQLTIPKIQSNYSLIECMDNRVSTRTFNPIDLTTLSTFLYRCLRIKNVKEYIVYGDDMKSDTMELLSSSYPSGGSIYELNFYITINDCEGLEAGFYHYNSFEHKLSFLQPKNNQTNSMLWYAKTCMGINEVPPVLITFSADFERMFWKYEHMAYAAILKNVGAVFQTMYLVATDMKIAACALGNGNIEVLQNLNKASFLQESSVGEFVIGKIKK
jgi:oxazoline/thiazoline dehydrogenase